MVAKKTQAKEPETVDDATESPTFKFDKDGPEYKVHELTETQQFLYNRILDIQQKKQELISQVQKMSINEDYITDELKNDLESDDSE